MVVPSKNFTSGFPHVGQRGIKEILDKNKINYSRKTIIKASDLKAKLEGLNINQATHSVISIDAVKMYPSVKFEMIERAVNYFLRNASDEDKKKAKECLEMVKFGMDNTFVTFEDKYWKYGGFLPVEEKGLTIGVFESAFFAYLVASYILEISEDHFEDSTYNGIYRDDGIDI